VTPIPVIIEGNEDEVAQENKYDGDDAKVDPPVAESLRTLTATLLTMTTNMANYATDIEQLRGELRAQRPQPILPSSEAEDLLPDRQSADGVQARPRGGAERADLRLAAAARVLVEKGEMTPEDFLHFEKTLRAGAKVPSPSLFAHFHGESERDRVGGVAFGRLREAGIAPDSTDGGTFLVNQLLRSATTQSEEDAKKKRHCATFAIWHKRWAKIKVLAAGKMATEPLDFAFFYWHFTSVLWVFAEHNWACASTYNDGVMTAWDNNELDVMTITSSPEHLAGNVKSALHRDSYIEARLPALTGTTKYGAADKSNTERVAYVGTDAKTATNTEFCSHHRKYYPKAAKHATASCRKGGADVQRG
jgi:hypothetical protein